MCCIYPSIRDFFTEGPLWFTSKCIIPLPVLHIPVLLGDRILFAFQAIPGHFRFDRYRASHQVALRYNGTPSPSSQTPGGSCTQRTPTYPGTWQQFRFSYGQGHDKDVNSIRAGLSLSFLIFSSPPPDGPEAQFMQVPFPGSLSISRRLPCRRRICAQASPSPARSAFSDWDLFHHVKCSL